MKKAGFVLIPLALIITAAIAWRWFGAPKIDANTLRVSGNIEVTDARLGFKIAGRLETCFVEEDQDRRLRCWPEFTIWRYDQ